jgi:NADH dehydrogenase
MQSRIVTIFGGSGFLGRHIVRALAKDGWRIRAGVRYPQLAEFLRPMGLVGQIQPVKASVTDDASVARAVEGADAVINLVGSFAGVFSDRQAFAINAEAAGRVARAAAAAGVSRLVHMSALGVSETSRSSYARSKAEGEAAVRAAFPNATILRPSVVFGPEDSFFNRFANMARYSPFLPLIGGGQTKFQPVFVGDVALAVKTVLAREPQAATYELGGPGVYTFRELMELTLKVTGRGRFLVPLPFPVASLMSWPMGLLPGAPLTPDQVRLLKTDNIVTDGAKGFADLGIVPDAAEAIVPGYLWRFRKTGQFQAMES